jgi:hypothetical protein
VLLSSAWRSPRTRQPIPEPVTLDALLATAQGRVGVVTANLELEEARQALIRTEADPLALRIDLVRARQAVELAEAEAIAARLEAMAEVAGAWARVREAELQVALAAAARDLSARAVEIARLRLERGSATRLDVEEAITASATPRRTSRRPRRPGAHGPTSPASPADGTVALEPLERERLERACPRRGLRGRAGRLPTVLQLTQAIELATSASSCSTRASPRAPRSSRPADQFAQAEAGAGEARRALTLRTRRC